VLGVSVVTAVLITNNSSQKAFALSSEALYGRTTHQITGAQGINERVYVSLKQQRPDITMAPVIQDHVVIDDTVYSILGLDPFTEAGFERSSSSTQSTLTPNKLFSSDALLVSELSIREHGLTIGESIELSVGGRQHVAMIAGALKTSNPVAASGLLIGDIAFVQTLLGRKDTIDRIDLILTSDQAASLAKLLPANFALLAR
jgi:putative ABC transport system permease protein